MKKIIYSCLGRIVFFVLVLLFVVEIGGEIVAKLPDIGNNLLDGAIAFIKNTYYNNRELFWVIIIIFLLIAAGRSRNY